MMNNGIKSMTNYANNYPPHINAIQQMVTQVITIPYQHTTCHCFSQFFFTSTLCFLSFLFALCLWHTLALCAFTLLFFSWPLADSLFFLSLGSRPLFFTMQHAFSNHTTIQEQWKCKYMLWMHVSKLVKVEEKKVMAQRGETKDIFVWLSVWVIGFRNECPNHIQT